MNTEFKTENIELLRSLRIQEKAIKADIARVKPLAEDEAKLIQPDGGKFTIDGIGDFAVSKGVVSLTNDQGTSYNMYVQVQNELQRAVNELRDETALQYFGKKYDALDSAAQRAVTQAIPMNISEAPPMDYSNNGSN